LNTTTSHHCLGSLHGGREIGTNGWDGKKRAKVSMIRWFFNGVMEEIYKAL